jgi:hypothetical protein
MSLTAENRTVRCELQRGLSRAASGSPSRSADDLEAREEERTDLAGSGPNGAVQAAPADDRLESTATLWPLGDQDGPSDR